MADGALDGAMSTRIAAVAFFAMGALCLAQDARYYRLLPEVVPSHFGISGAPDAWMPKARFALFYAVVVVVVAVILLIGACAGRRLRSFFFWTGAATFALFFDIFGQAFRVALGQERGLTRPWLDLGLYVAFVLLIAIAQLGRVTTTR